ncbi:cyclin-dependent kinase 4 inhibitor C isoform X1 [Cottoperca gobio]|uniref:Cyclin-dependent kinase 4 inhibitor C isoform X1 n=1 Tax=Cottoperca gobio TaxID=56716 RepID=A0A6J2PJN0_COTGO|nr:cyclin-dependent kinase 4 inhibitor C isoform X1 [Cottoperca gobio]XP_029285846.1 cyclin-dependent kinase 4 inhibitor C isoform X1 [Cottoperca gobio]XP_029285847.1 cyclin-dependent kinase 4 inhibitor C isoform X1 [Cottoperca gobio]XP_029285849.1 cyclin-dependent kinase 4 inhibitor C isoform X1 [Cottoperca gobio]XP_029285850.1 cyclin-dependent kinase 4 inhibitor C isoform X1 [Cottoperca gobio]
MTDTLCNASARGDLHQVLLLLQNGADVNGLNTSNRTALQVVNFGNVKVVEALLEAGADTSVRDPVLNLTVMHDAARAGYIDSVRMLMDHGADINLTDDVGNLPLHLAAMEGNLEATQLLIERTANPQTPNGQGHTAGQLAHQHGRVDTAKYIDDYLSSH